jgi:hypothetical protein
VNELPAASEKKDNGNLFDRAKITSEGMPVVEIISVFL